MTLVNSLDLAAWVLPSRDHVIPLTTFRLDTRSYTTLLDWTRARTGRPDAPAVAVLKGLHEIVSLFVPDVAFVTIGQGQGLEMTFTGHVADDQERRVRLRLALSTWLGTVYGTGTTPQQRGDVANAAMRDDNWTVEDVSMLLRGRGALACDEPLHPRLWDALTAQAVRALAGRPITFASGITKRLVPTVPTTGAFEGIELVAFPPNASPNRGGGYWTEVVTICTANLPEREGIHLVARMSIRNWGAVGSRTKGKLHRSLDVFLPQVPDLEHLGPQRHGAFPLRVVQDGGPGVARTFTGKWEHKEDENVFGVLSRLTGIDGLPTQGGLVPFVSGDGIWVLPRLGSGHGDRFLPGGTGVPMPDRRALAEAVERVAVPLGLERLPPIQRCKKVRGTKLDAAFAGEDEVDMASRRAALARALKTVNGNPEGDVAVLDLFMFGRREAAASDLRTAVAEVLGQPEAEGDILRWADGLEVRLHAHPAGPLSEGLHPWEDPTDEDRRRFPAETQWKAERARRQKEGNEAARGRMEDWARQCRGSVRGICCAVLEIPEEFRDNYDDPFVRAKQVLAEERFLPQVVLVKGVTKAGPDTSVRHRFYSAFSDLLRSLGVVPMGGDGARDLAALTVAQVNTSMQAGVRVQSQAVPLAAQVRDGVLWAALPDANGLPEWRPYPEVYLSMTRGGHARFDRGRKPENQARFASFWKQALRDISNAGGAVVLMDAASGRQWMTGTGNGKLTFDRLEIGGGNTPLLPSDLPGVRVVRVTSNDSKLPSYLHDENAGWVSGVFAFSGSTRTAFGLKQKPQTNKLPKAFLTTSRHQDPDAGAPSVKEDKERKFASIDETCAFFLQEGDEPMAVVQRVNGLRGVHAQYGDYTSLPYPLHELALLKNAITG